MLAAAHGSSASTSVGGDGSASAQRESAFEQQLHGLSFSSKRQSARGSTSPTSPAAATFGSEAWHLGSHNAILEADVVDIRAVPAAAAAASSGSKPDRGEVSGRLVGDDGNALATASRRASAGYDPMSGRCSRVLTDTDWERFDLHSKRIHSVVREHSVV